MPINGLALGSVAAGSLFLYSAIKGKSILATVQAIVSGQSPKSVSQANPITENTPTGSAAASGGGIGPHTGVPGAGQVYTSAQIRQLWIANGGDPGKADIAVCIAQHESGGNSKARNPIECASGSHAEGIWQICMPLNAVHVPGGDAFDPGANAKAAISMSNNGRNWSAWSTAGSCGV
jgi:lysozyme-like protein